MLRRALITAVALAAGMCAALAVAACSTQMFSGTATTGRAAAATTFTALSGSGSATTPTVSTVTQQQVTEVQTHTTATGTSTTSTASQLPGYKRPVVQLGDMNTNEQFILGNLYAIALKHQGYTVVLNSNIGPTEISQAALKQGSLMIYPEYLNVWNSSVVHNSTSFTSLGQAFQTGQQYAESKNWKLLQPTPFSNTAGIAVSSQYARLNHVYSLTDLDRGPAITLGWPPEADVQPLLAQVETAYGFNPASKQSIAIGTQYAELANNTLQASYVNSTDPQLTGPGYVLLRDPKHTFGFGNVVPVTTDKVLAEEGPEFELTINRVSALLTQSAIRGLNYQVAVEQQSPSTVAEQFLQGNGVIPPTNYAPVTTTSTTASSSTGTATTATSGAGSGG